MAGSKLFFLRDEFERGPLGERSPDIVGAVADHERDAGRHERRGGPDDALDDGQAADRVQDLGPLRLHPRALPGGEHYDVDVQPRYVSPPN